MNSKVLSLFVVILCVVVGAVVFLNSAGKETAPVEQPAPAAPKEVEQPAPVEPEPEVAEAPEVPKSVAEKAAEELQSGEVVTREQMIEKLGEIVEEAKQPTGNEKPFVGIPITTETLKDCIYKDGKLNIQFAANHDWIINGRVTAKWEIVGDRVRLYKDGSDEVHWLDIDNDKLLFNGERINLYK